MGSKRLLFLLCIGFSTNVHAHEVIAFIPGYDGATPFIMQTIPKLMQARKIDFRSYPVVSQGDIRAHGVLLAQLLEAELAVDPRTRFHLVGHSMGGLVARYAVAHLSVQLPGSGLVRLQKLVRSLTTLATPHYGTPMAQYLMASPAASQMTESAAAALWNNPKNPAFYSPVQEGFPTTSVVAYIKQAAETNVPLLVFGFLTMQGMGLYSDGLIPVESQIFGQEFGRAREWIRADHLYFNTPTLWSHLEPVEDFYERLSHDLLN